MKTIKTIALSIAFALGSIAPSTSIAAPSNNDLTSSLHQSFSTLLHTEEAEMVMEAGVEATILFTVTENQTLHVVNVLSHDQGIKEYLAKQLEGADAASGLKQGEVYAIDFSFLKL